VHIIQVPASSAWSMRPLVAMMRMGNGRRSTSMMKLSQVGGAQDEWQMVVVNSAQELTWSVFCCFIRTIIWLAKIS
jgi:hypothetical protein